DLDHDDRLVGADFAAPEGAPALVVVKPLGRGVAQIARGAVRLAAKTVAVDHDAADLGVFLLVDRRDRNRLGHLDDELWHAHAMPMPKAPTRCITDRLADFAV